MASEKANLLREKLRRGMSLVAKMEDIEEKKREDELAKKRQAMEEIKRRKEERKNSSIVAR